MNLQEKKDKLREMSLQKLAFNGGEIYVAIDEGYLDNVISKLSDKDIKRNNKVISSIEQLYDLLSGYYYFIELHLSPLQNRSAAFDMTLDEKTPDFLLSTKDFNDGNNREYFMYEMKKTLVGNMYKNILYIYEGFRDLFEKANIYRGMKLNEKNVDILFNFLKELLWCNQGQFHCYYIFEDHELNGDIPKNRPDREREILKHGQYYTQWEFLLDDYRKKSEYAKKIISI